MSADKLAEALEQCATAIRLHETSEFNSDHPALHAALKAAEAALAAHRSQEQAEPEPAGLVQAERAIHLLCGLAGEVSTDDLMTAAERIFDHVQAERAEHARELENCRRNVESRDALIASWRPIETAPKNGTNILLLNRSGMVASALWLDGALGTGWFLRGGNQPNHFFNGHWPTHWMPLPTPPTQTEPGGEQT